MKFLKDSRNICNIVLVAGTRPEIIKLFPIIKSFKNTTSLSTYYLIWSGQHYDYNLSRIFFEEIDGLEPDYDLCVGSSSHGVQTAKIIQGVEKVLRNIKGKGVVTAVGDTNTVLSAGLASTKAGWIFAHIEAGLRSFDRYMPEEINRVVADHVANVLFAPSVQAVLNLLYEGVDPWRVYLTGNTIVDAVKMVMPRVTKERDRVLAELGIEEPYALVTLHRAENVDHAERLTNILKGLKEVSNEIKLVFPIHPRTKRRIKEFGLDHALESIKVIEPIGYIGFLALLNKALAVFTDSGGVQEEAFTLGVPCITLRKNTERPETVWLGGNILVGDDPKRIVEAYKYISEYRETIVKKIKNAKNPYGDGRAGKRMATILKRLVEDSAFFKRFSYSKESEPDYRDSDYPSYVVLEGNVFEGMKVEDIHRKYRGIYVTLTYDEHGKPIIPYSDIVIKKGWRLRVWGPRKLIEKLLR